MSAALILPAAPVVAAVIEIAGAVPPLLTIGAVPVTPVTVPILLVYPEGLVAAYAPISARDQETFAEPFTDFPVLPIVIVLAVPQLAVVMFADPLNEVPLIFLAVCNVVAVVELPLNAPEKVTADTVAGKLTFLR